MKPYEAENKGPLAARGARPGCEGGGSAGRRRYLHLGLLDGLLPYLLVVGPDLEGEEAEGTAGPAAARAAPHSPSSGTRKWHPCRQRPWARGAPGPGTGTGPVTLETAASPVLDCLRLRPPRPRPGSTGRAPSAAPPPPRLRSGNKQPGSKGQNQTLFIKKILYRKKFYAFRWTILQRNSLTV